MSDGFEASAPPVRLRRFDVVPKTPIRDPLNLNGSNVVAESESEAWQYLQEVGRWVQATGLPTLRTQYSMVPRATALTEFRGTKSEWIQAVHLGYLPAPVYLAPDAKTQERLDREWEEDEARHRRRVLEMSRLTLLEAIGHWFGKQKDHPLRWKAIGVVALGIAGLVFWQLVVAFLVNAAAVVVFIWLVKR